MNSSDTVTIGKDLTVTRIGLGTNRIGDDDRSRQALKKAVELGISFIDTAAAYTGGVSEQTIGETLAPYKNIVVATKGGMVPPDFHIDASLESLSRSLETSLKSLRLTTIPLYFLHRIDPNVPLEDTLTFLKQMQKEGKIKHIGLSQVTIDQIEKARETVDVVAVENEYNLTERTYDDVVNYAEKEGIVFVPFFPLHFDDSKASVVEKLRQKYDTTAEQIALAWLLKRSPVMLPIPGSLSAQHLEENVKALRIHLSDEDFQLLS